MKTKLAMIRNNESDVCPFGLVIPDACQLIGELIDQMAPLSTMKEDQQKDLKQANNRLFKWHAPGLACKYAAKIMDNHNSVECNFADSDAGEGTPSFLGSPNYTKHFSGIGLDGLYTFPLGYYADNSIDRSYYYGNYSIESIAQEENSTNKMEYVGKTLSEVKK